MAHVDEDVRMVEGGGRARAHEFLHADFDHLMTAVVLEMGNAVPGHVRLRYAIQRGGPYRPSIEMCRAKHAHELEKIG
jgi:hypothetical protein